MRREERADLEARGCGDGNIWVNLFDNIDY